jgi:glycosyltransferase involved in cell wall biosynthesis
MRIAQVAPLYESVPPKTYGGTERVVYYLTEELVRRGQQVTLFASGDSVTKAELVPGCERSLRLSKSVDPLPHHYLMFEQVFKRAKDFDVIHFHVDYLHFPLSRRNDSPHLTTLHGRLDLPDLPPLYHEFGEMPVISISDAQRRPLPFANWLGTVHHGLPENLFTFREQPEDYLVFLGRISPEKRVDRAIEIARRAGRRLKIAAKVDKVDRRYFNKMIKPLLDHPFVEYLGEIGQREKNELLGGAAGLLFPIDWPEPFGLVMIEALACGTPVLAFRCGSVPEVISDGVSGVIVEEIDAAVAALEKLAQLDRRQCRQEFERSFTARRMADDYMRFYARVIAEKESARPRVAAPTPLMLAPFTGEAPAA